MAEASKAATLIGVSEPVILTIDNGGSRTRLARYRVNRLGRVRGYETPASYDTAVYRLGKVASKALRQGVFRRQRRPDAVGISVAGKLDGGKIVSAGKLQEYGWVGKSLAVDVATELGVPAERVVDLNDCVAGANAERNARQIPDGHMGAFMVLSTGFGGALYTRNKIIPDEPGHRYLKPGAVCGCRKEGHIEAHIGGDGIEKKYGVRGENIPHDDANWNEIKGDFADGMALTMLRYEEEHGRTPMIVGFTGSVALGGPNMLGQLQVDLTDSLGVRAPLVVEAVYGEESGLYGAAFAARDLLSAERNQQA